MDPRVTRRSARLQEAQRPPYPQSQQSLSSHQSPSGSAFHSSSSLTSISSINTNVSQSPMMDQHGARFGSAPLPSPSQTQQTHYFPSVQQTPSHQQAQQMHMQRQMQMTQQQQQSQYAGQAGGPQFDLLAEAAKRAQMACLMRDFGDVEL